MAKTLEECKKCPKCGSVGTEVRKDRRAGGAMVHTIHCQNKACKWFATGWAVQVNPDGTVPERDVNDRYKQFPDLTDSQKTAGSRIIEQVKEADK